MLDLRYVVDHLEEVKEALGRRNAEAFAPLSSIGELAEQRRLAIAESQSKSELRNQANGEMAKLPKSSPEFAEKREALRRLSTEVAEATKRQNEVEASIERILLTVPNLPDREVPVGADESGNRVVRYWGEKPAIAQPKQHWEIGGALGILDFERAAKLSGPRFNVLLGHGARLSRALGQFMLDVHGRDHGYTEVLPPLLVKDSAMIGTGQLPKFADDSFRTVKSDPEKTYDLYLIPTAEVPVTNLHADEVIDARKLPLAYVAHTPCFRSEAGSYGKDVRGLIRQHQFEKVELVRFVSPESSMAELEKLTDHAEEILRRLGLHHRVVLLCTGDMGFAATKTYDLEVWLPGQGAYREISSCSNCGDFQARRAQIRMRDEQGKKPRLLHTLNGSALAVGRTLVAVLEQYQQPDGSVVVPEVLRPYLRLDVLRP